MTSLQAYWIFSRFEAFFKDGVERPPTIRTKMKKTQLLLTIVTTFSKLLQTTMV